MMSRTASLDGAAGGYAWIHADSRMRAWWMLALRIAPGFRRSRSPAVAAGDHVAYRDRVSASLPPRPSPVPRCVVRPWPSDGQLPWSLATGLRASATLPQCYHPRAP